MLVRVKFYGCHNSISKPWGYEEMENPSEKVNIGAFCDAKKKVFTGEGLLTYSYVNDNQNISSNIIF